MAQIYLGVTESNISYIVVGVAQSDIPGIFGLYISDIALGVTESNISYMAVGVAQSDIPGILDIAVVWLRYIRYSAGCD